MSKNYKPFLWCRLREQPLASALLNSTELVPKVVAKWTLTFWGPNASIQNSAAGITRGMEMVTGKAGRTGWRDTPDYQCGNR